LAIASVLSGRPVRRDLAMTGEVTLRGKVLEIGGVKEKVLAAYRAGLRELIMPKSNEKDLRDVPDEVRKNISFMFVDRMDEVLHIALLPPVPRELADRAEPEMSPGLAGMTTREDREEAVAMASSPTHIDDGSLLEQLSMERSRDR
jgi:ATP-dependent Lon protease